VKALLIFLMVLNLPSAFSHWRENPEVLKVEISPGDHWNKTLPRKKQLYISEHVRGIKDLYRAGHVVVNSFDSVSNTSTLLIQGMSEKNVKQKILTTPIFKSGVLRARITPSKLLMFNAEGVGHGH